MTPVLPGVKCDSPEVDRLEPEVTCSKPEVSNAGPEIDRDQSEWH